MDIEKVIEKINRQILIGKCEKNIAIPVYISNLEIILSELDKKDKIIEDIKFINNNNKPHIAQQKIRGYFTNKVEEDIKE